MKLFAGNWMCSQHLQLTSGVNVEGSLEKKNTSLPHQILKNLRTRNNFILQEIQEFFFFFNNNIILQTYPSFPDNCEIKLPTNELALQNSESVPVFKARKILYITHSKWGCIFSHISELLAGTYKARIMSISPLYSYGKKHLYHKARTGFLTSLCQNVLTLNVKNLFLSSLWMSG